MAAALATQSAGKVRQKARASIHNPCVFYALKAFFLHMAANKGNPDLQIVTFSGTDLESACGKTLLVGEACTLYVAWGKKTNTATDSYLSVIDDTVDDTGFAADTRAVLAFPLAGVATVGGTTPGDNAGEAIQIFPDGIPMATGIVVAAYTAANGGTQSSAGDAPNGFLIIGA